MQTLFLLVQESPNYILKNTDCGGINYLHNSTTVCKFKTFFSQINILYPIGVHFKIKAIVSFRFKAQTAILNSDLGHQPHTGDSR